VGEDEVGAVVRGGFLVFFEEDGERGAAVMEVGEQAAEVGIASAGFGEKGEVGTIGKGDFGAGDGGDAGGLGELGELHGAVEAVVVGDGERVVAERDRLGDEVLREGRAVEEGVCGVEVKLGVHGVPGDGLLGGYGRNMGGVVVVLLSSVLLYTAM
jgi:hypothetical protein